MALYYTLSLFLFATVLTESGALDGHVDADDVSLLQASLEIQMPAVLTQAEDEKNKLTQAEDDNGGEQDGVTTNATPASCWSYYSDGAIPWCQGGKVVNYPTSPLSACQALCDKTSGCVAIDYNDVREEGYGYKCNLRNCEPSSSNVLATYGWKVYSPKCQANMKCHGEFPTIGRWYGDTASDRWTVQALNSWLGGATFFRGGKHNPNYNFILFQAAAGSGQHNTACNDYATEIQRRLKSNNKWSCWYVGDDLWYLMAGSAPGWECEAEAQLFNSAMNQAYASLRVATQHS